MPLPGTTYNPYYNQPIGFPQYQDPNQLPNGVLGNPELFPQTPYQQQSQQQQAPSIPQGLSATAIPAGAGAGANELSTSLGFGTANSPSALGIGAGGGSAAGRPEIFGPGAGWSGGASTAQLLPGAIVGGMQLQGVQQVASGDKLSPQNQAALALPTFGASFLYNPVKDLFSHTEKNKKERMGIKSAIGDYGKFQGANGPMDINQAGYNVKFSPDDKIGDSGGYKPYVNEAVAMVDPFAEIITQHLGASPDRREQLTGEIYNTISQGADNVSVARNNVLQFIKNYGFKPDQVLNDLKTLKDAGKIDENRYNVYVQNVNSLIAKKKK